MADSYLIVGAGCFGASTARALKAKYPNADVCIIDPAPFPDAAAAAHDFNKIIRAEYNDATYMALALEAKQAWSGADAVVAPFFHQTGALWSVTGGRTTRLEDNYRKTLGRVPLEVMSLDDVRTRFPALSGCRFEGGAEQCILSPEAGWAEAAGALGAVLGAAVDSGVRYEVATVERLRFDGDDACTGVFTTDGRTFEAQRVILCSGAYTPWLLAESAPEKPDLHAGQRLIAAAVLMCVFKVPPGEDGLDRFKGAPVMVHPFGEFPAECIPPGDNSTTTRDLAKCTHEFPYMRKTYHEPSKQNISVPPLSKAELMTWTTTLPDALTANSRSVRNMFFGDSVQGMVPESYRLCWDSSTPDEDWIISPHPASKNLYIVGGGSFHAFKFLPIIGKYVVQMIDGKLSEVHARKWAWDKDITPIVTAYTPRGDLKDVPGYHD